jgi:hypothetical protein
MRSFIWGFAASASCRSAPSFGDAGRAPAAPVGVSAGAGAVAGAGGPGACAICAAGDAAFSSGVVSRGKAIQMTTAPAAAASGSSQPSQRREGDSAAAASRPAASTRVMTAAST